MDGGGLILTLVPDLAQHTCFTLITGVANL